MQPLLKLRLLQDRQKMIMYISSHSIYLILSLRIVKCILIFLVSEILYLGWPVIKVQQLRVSIERF